MNYFKGKQRKFKEAGFDGFVSLHPFSFEQEETVDSFAGDCGGW